MIQDEYINLTIGKQKHIALIAHDSKKKSLVAWVDRNKEILQHHFLCGTGTTARLIADYTGLPIKGYNSGPLGGDQQIGARIVEGTVDFVVFFWDPLESQPHDPDVKALLRIAVVYNIPIANNEATADFLLTSRYMNETYEHPVLNYNRTISDRLAQFGPDK
jgi:methylglyoxal synthase